MLTSPAGVVDQSRPGTSVLSLRRSAMVCRFHALALGEVMLRLDPGEGRIRTARQFKVWEGGGEYNVARALRKCFGMKTALCTAFVDNEVGHLTEDFIMQGGVDTDFILWRKDDGIGRTIRNGLNFVERGFGVRGAVSVSDRGNSAASQLKPGDFDWEDIFSKQGTLWFHTGGIFAGLSATTHQLVIEAMQAARKYGAIISYDLNYRPSLWKGIGGPEKAQEVNKAIAPLVDVMIGNEEDFTQCLGFEVPGVDPQYASIASGNFRTMIEKAATTYPNFKVVATTLRSATTASINDWSAICWAGGTFYDSIKFPGTWILDRVGGGDSFASGLIYGLMTKGDPQYAVNCGAAHGALAMTTPGDTSMATLKEVEAAMKGGSARIQR